MSTTAGNIIRSGLAKAGILGAGRRVGADDLAFCLRALKLMCDSMKLGPQWAYKRTETVATVGPAQSVTLGPLQTINMPRPVAIERDSFVRVGGVDHPLEPVDRITYNRISQKNIGTSWPTVCHWDGGSPTGLLFLWPVAAAELHLVTRDPVAGFADATTQYDLPDGLEELLVYGLAERVAPDFQVKLPDGVATVAKGLRRAWKRTNVRVPQLTVGSSRVDPQSEFIAGN